ncbi:T9SS type A sorting domain-containing protein [Adhaeribacter terreus]|uniref:T9SS type A sorting domain-containing protein n=1 Tax=Adhaeribacter terreus TaxID=529703 RepID=A0ABW0E805_9BACT
MRKALLLFIFLLQISFVAQSQQYVNANYGRALHERAIKCVVQTDSTVLMLGFGQGYSYVLHRTKTNGDTLYSKYVYSHDFYYGVDLIALPNEKAIIVGGNGGLAKIDPYGNETWSKSFRRTEYNAGALINDTTFAVVGSKGIFSHMEMVPDLGWDSIFISRVYIGLYHVSGKLLQEKVVSYGTDDYEEARGIIYTTNKTLLVEGDYYRYEPNSFHDDFLLTLTPDLKVIADTVYPRGTVYGKPKMENSQGNFMNCAFKTVKAAQDNDIFIQELNANGDILWEKTYDLKGDDYATAMLESDGYYYVTGGTGNKKNILPEYDDIVLLKLDLQGDTIWTKTYTLPSGQGAVDIKELNDSMLVILGVTDYQTQCPQIMNPGYICSDMYLMYVNKETGYSKMYPDAPQTILAKSEVLVYPNPSHGQVSIKAKEIKSVTVRNAIGKAINAKQRAVSEQETEISGLEKGIYFMLVETEKGFENKRVVIM